MCVCVVCVCVLFVYLFQDDLRVDLRCLFSPHQVNPDMVVSRRILLKSVCTSPTRLKLSGDSEVVGSIHSGQVGKLLVVLIPPHQRLDLHVDLNLHVVLKLVFLFDRGHVEIHGYGTKRHNLFSFLKRFLHLNIIPQLQQTSFDSVIQLV